MVVDHQIIYPKEAWGYFIPRYDEVFNRLIASVCEVFLLRQGFVEKEDANPERLGSTRDMYATFFGAVQFIKVSHWIKGNNVVTLVVPNQVGQLKAQTKVRRVGMVVGYFEREEEIREFFVDLQSFLDNEIAKMKLEPVA